MRGLTSGSFTKSYELGAVSEVGLSGADVHACERRFLGRLQGTGLVPDVLSMHESPTHAEIRLVHHLPLLLWMLDHQDARASMASAIQDQLRRLHEQGVCHRDVHEHNVVVDRQDTPLFIDFELAIDVSSSNPCYDRLGPASGVPVPAAHTRVGLTGGVWWDSEAPNGFGLSACFGPLAEATDQPPSAHLH